MVRLLQPFNDYDTFQLLFKPSKGYRSLPDISSLDITSHNPHLDQSSMAEFEYKSKMEMRIGCVLTWHQWLLGRISNCAGITDLAKNHPVASALRFARNLTYNEYAFRDNEYFCSVK